MNNRDNTSIFPLEILLNIFSYLTPEILFSLCKTHIFSCEFHNNLFWKREFNKHFPHHFQPHLALDWKLEFIKTYNDEYRYLSANNKKIFSLLKSRDNERVKEKIKNLNDLDLKDNKNISILKWAQQTNNQSILNYFYQLALNQFRQSDEKIDVEKIDTTRTILWWAVQCRQNLNQIITLLNQNPLAQEKILSRGYEYLDSHIIHLAAAQGLLDFVRYLIERDPNLLEIANALKKTPLVFAADNGQEAVLDYLIEEKANLNVITSLGQDNWNDDTGWTPIHFAIRAKQTKTAIKLIKAGANIIRPVGSMYYQTIHMAAEEGLLDVVKTLIETNPSLLEANERYGKTPLILAIINNHENIIHYLLSKKANVNALYSIWNAYFNNPLSQTPVLYSAIKYQCSPKILTQLLQANASPYYQTLDSNKLSLLNFAINENNWSAAKILVEFYPELLNQMDEFGKSPLHRAVMGKKDKNKDAFIDYIISIRIDLNVSIQCPGHCDHGKSILYWAMENQDYTNAKKLANAGANATVIYQDSTLKFTPIIPDTENKTAANIKTQDNSLNSTQKALIEGFFNAIFLSLSKNGDYNPANFFFIIEELLKKGGVSQEKISQFEMEKCEHEILLINEIFIHPCPQNKTESDYSINLSVDSKLIHYRNGSGRLICAPKGILNLTEKNDATAAPVTREAVIHFIRHLLTNKMETTYIQAKQIAEKKYSSYLKVNNKSLDLIKRKLQSTDILYLFIFFKANPQITKLSLDLSSFIWYSSILDKISDAIKNLPNLSELIIKGDDQTVKMANCISKLNSLRIFGHIDEDWLPTILDPIKRNTKLTHLAIETDCGYDLHNKDTAVLTSTITNHTRYKSFSLFGLDKRIVDIQNAIPSLFEQSLFTVKQIQADPYKKLKAEEVVKFNQKITSLPEELKKKINYK